MEFRDRLYQLRRGRGISQEELANAVGVSRQAVQKWEAGSSTPDLDTCPPWRSTSASPWTTWCGSGAGGAPGRPGGADGNPQLLHPLSLPLRIPQQMHPLGPAAGAYHLGYGLRRAKGSSPSATWPPARWPWAACPPGWSPWAGSLWEPGPWRAGRRGMRLRRTGSGGAAGRGRRGPQPGSGSGGRGGEPLRGPGRPGGGPVRRRGRRLRLRAGHRQ